MYPLILDWDRLKNVSTFSVMNGGITGEGQILLLILYQKLDTTLSYTDTIHYPVIHRYQTLLCQTQILDSRHFPVIHRYMSNTDTKHYLIKHRYWTLPCQTQILDTSLSNTLPCHTQILDNIMFLIFFSKLLKMHCGNTQFYRF